MSTDGLERLAQCICTHHAASLQVEKARADLANLRHDGLVIAEGERAFIGELEVLLEQVAAKFVEVRKACSTQDSKSIDSTLERIETALNDPRWSLLDAVCSEISRKKELQVSRNNAFTDTLEDAADKLGEFRVLLENAKLFNAAIVRELDTWTKLNRRFEQANSSVNAQRATAYVEMDQLAKEMANVDDLIRSVREKKELAKDIRKRADLLVLRSAGDAPDRLQYDALLRTASEPGIHGISVHATSTIVKQDRDELSAKMDEVTKLIRAGGLRAAGAIEVTEDSTSDGVLSFVETADSSITREIGSAIGIRSPARDVSLKETGEFMYGLLLPEAVQRYLEDAKCSLSLTTNDLDLPWELMYDGKEYLCIQRPVARMPMGTYLPQDRSVPDHEKIHFLFVYPSPELTGAAREVEKIKERLQAFGKRVVIDELGPKEATGRALNQALSSGKYHVIHFAGHAQFDKKDPDQSGLILPNGEIFFAQKARRLLKGRPLVFLNACESGRAENDPTMDTGSYLQRPAAGLASSFIYGGALGCVGAVWPIYDDSASFLATELYSELLEGTMIGEAMRRARERTRKNFSRQVTWAAFVLYGDPTFQLSPSF